MVNLFWVDYKMMRQDKKEVAITIMLGLGAFKEDSQGRLSQWEHYGERRRAPFTPGEHRLWTKCHGRISNQ